MSLIPSERRHARRFIHNLVAISTGGFHTLVTYYGLVQDWLWVSSTALHVFFGLVYVVNFSILWFVRSERVMSVDRYQLIFWETVWALCYLIIASLFFIEMRFPLYLVGLLSLGFAAFRLTSKQSWRLFYLFCIGYAFGIWFRTVVTELSLDISQELIELSMIVLLGVGFVIMGQAMMRLRETNKSKTEELKSALQRLETVTVQDDLTSVYNRKHILDVVRRFHSLHKRNKTPVSICYIDVDSFRNINESFGHLAGDEVLMQISKLANDSCRDSDVFGRLGGEEFILVLPETDIHGATVLAKRLNKLVKELRFNSIHYMLQVTVSVGIAQINDSETAEDFIKRAELAMIDAKEAGRDKVCCSTSPDLCAE